MTPELELKDLLTAAMLPERRAAVETALAEIERLSVEIEWLRSLVRTAIPFMNDAGNDEDPDAQTIACAWLEDARAALEPKP